MRVQTTKWIRFVKDDDRVELAFNSRMTNVHQGSDLDQVVDGMITHMKTQIENPALLNSRFRFDEVLFSDVNFHRLNLTRGSSYLPPPDWIEKKKAIINPQNDDEECFKWAVITALEWTDIKSHPERVSNLRKFVDNYDWSGLRFPVSIKDIREFEIENNISINILAVEGRDIYIHRKTDYKSNREINKKLPYLYWTAKLHKSPVKHRFIAGSSKCTTKELSSLLTKILTVIKTGLENIVVLRPAILELIICGYLRIPQIYCHH